MGQFEKRHLDVGLKARANPAHLPCVSKQALSELQTLVDRLGPGMRLVLDEVAVERYFGRTFHEAYGIARAFAETNGCIFKTRCWWHCGWPGYRCRVRSLARDLRHPPQH